jgi:L-arabinose isomerase
VDIARKKPLAADIGIFGVGHRTYWSQYPGLLDTLQGYLWAFDAKIRGRECTTSNFGIADEAESAYRIMKQIKAADPDLVFCDMLTYATSATWGIMAREIDTPIVLVALQPDQAMDYENATTFMQLVNDPICALPEFVGVSVRMGKAVPPCIIGTLDDDADADADIDRWCRIARVLHDLRGARIGHMGHSLESMLDMNFDPTSFTAQFGLHVVHTEPDDVMKHFRRVTEEEVSEGAAQILSFFDTPDPGSEPDTRKLTDADLAVAARTHTALDRFIQEKNLDGLAYYYEGEEGSEMRALVTNFIVGNSLLTAAGFPMCGESDLKTCVAMLIFDRLGIGGSFAEFHPVDFKEGFILVGHDGPHHINIAEGRPVLRSLVKYHGKPGAGASVEFSIKTGPITMMSIGQKYDGRFKFVIAEGESVAGPIPATGNTNTRGFFGPDPVTFLKKWLAEGPTHHFALGIGHHAEDLVQLGNVLGIEAVDVTSH